MKSAVSNSSPLILLAKINQIQLLLKIFDKIYIPKEVYVEVIEKGKEQNCPEVTIIEELIDKENIIVKKNLKNIKRKIESKNLHSGEIEAIQLALSLPSDTILLDDEEARIYARGINLKVRSTLGIIVECLMKQYISKQQAISCLKQLNQIMYLSSFVYEITLDKINNACSQLLC